MPINAVLVGEARAEAVGPAAAIAIGATVGLDALFGGPSPARR